MSAPLIHVSPTDTGMWVVRPEDVATPISQHGTETEAERAALERAAARRAAVMVHDRYSRVHVVRPRVSR